MQEKKQILLVVPPSNLTSDPCDVDEAGETVSSLAQAYVTNAGCIGQYKVKMNSLRDWRDSQTEIYKNNKQ